MRVGGCPLCDAEGGHLVFTGPSFRVVRAEEAGYPAFYRLVWNDHVREFSDLSDAERGECLDAVVCIERVLRDKLAPAKINLAAFGNMVPHLHWHVIARFEWDPAWPGAVWAAPQRHADPQRLAEVERSRPQIEEALRQMLSRTP